MLINFVLGVAGQYGAIPFGGYVRDYLIGAEPNDLDLLFSRRGLVDTFAKTIALSPDHSMVFNETKSGYAIGGFCTTYYVVDRHSQLTVKVDCVVNEVCQCDPTTVRMSVDFDINSLVGTWDHNSLSVKVNDDLQCLQFLEVINNIRLKQFRVCGLLMNKTSLQHPAVTQNGHVCYSPKSSNGKKLVERAQKLVAKGWTCVSKCDHPDCWLVETL